MSERGRASLADRAAALGVDDERVLAAVRRVPRVAFVPPAARLLANRDAPIPIGYGQTTSQPSLVAYILGALRLSAADRVLEVGTGLGYQTALLAQLVRHVYSIDRYAELVEAARRNLDRQQIDNVTLTTGDGTLGWPEHAPYDAIVVSAAFARVPPPLIAQLRAGGRLVQPLGRRHGDDLVLFRRHGDTLVVDRHLGAARFVPLRGRHGLQEDDRS